MRFGMKTFKKYLWLVFALFAMTLVIVLGINQQRNIEWELLQTKINISGKEVIQIFDEAGIHLENIKNITSSVEKGLYGKPISAFVSALKQEKMYNVDILEYQDWRTANQTYEFQKGYLESNSIDYKGGMFSHGAVLIFINPPNEDLEAQLKKILMDRYNLTKQNGQTK
jgi:hypothetical protein